MTRVAAAKRKRDQNDQGAATHHGHAPSGPDFAPYMNHHGDGELELAEVLAKHNAGGANANSAGASDQAATDTASAALNFSNTDPSFLDHADQSETHPEPNFDIDAPPAVAPAADSEYAVDQLKAGATTKNERGSRAGGASSGPATGGDRGASSPGDDEEDLSNAGAGASGTPRHKVGSDEWAASRRLAHKEVERRRREAINDGITELGKMVPGAERNKGSILQRTVQYINDLRDRQAQTDQKNNLEKMVFEQAIAEVTATADKLKSDVRRLEGELERWRAAARAAGVEDVK